MLTPTLMHVVHRRRFRKLVGILLLVTVVIAVMIVPIEREAGGKIQTWFDGIWWTVTTLTTVGYGDYVPISFIGRILGMFLQVVGVVCFGLLVGMVGATMDRNHSEFQWKRNWQRLDDIEGLLRKIGSENEFMIKKEEKKNKK